MVEDQAGVSSVHRQLAKKQCIQDYQRCGASNVNGGSSTCCTSSFTCQGDAYYSQCKPIPSPPPPPPPSPFTGCSLDTMAAAKALVAERNLTLQAASSKFSSLLSSSALATEWESFVNMLP